MRFRDKFKPGRKFEVPTQAVAQEEFSPSQTSTPEEVLRIRQAIHSPRVEVAQKTEPVKTEAPATASRFDSSSFSTDWGRNPASYSSAFHNFPLEALVQLELTGSELHAILGAGYFRLSPLDYEYVRMFISRMPQESVGNFLRRTPDQLFELGMRTGFHPMYYLMAWQCLKEPSLIDQFDGVDSEGKVFFSKNNPIGDPGTYFVSAEFLLEPFSGFMRLLCENGRSSRKTLPIIEDIGGGETLPRKFRVKGTMDLNSSIVTSEDSPESSFDDFDLDDDLGFVEPKDEIKEETTEEVAEAAPAAEPLPEEISQLEELVTRMQYQLSDDEGMDQDFENRTFSFLIRNQALLAKDAEGQNTFRAILGLAALARRYKQDAESAKSLLASTLRNIRKSRKEVAIDDDQDEPLSKFMTSVETLQQFIREESQDESSDPSLGQIDTVHPVSVQPEQHSVYSDGSGQEALGSPSEGDGEESPSVGASERSDDSGTDRPLEEARIPESGEVSFAESCREAEALFFESVPEEYSAGFRAFVEETFGDDRGILQGSFLRFIEAAENGSGFSGVLPNHDPKDPNTQRVYVTISLRSLWSAFFAKRQSNGNP